jgi:hypothetical protein
MLKPVLASALLSSAVSIASAQTAPTPGSASPSPTPAASAPKKHYLHGPKMHPRGKPVNNPDEPPRKKYGD